MAVAEAPPIPDQAEDKPRPRKGQLSFDGFPINRHRVKISGTTIEIPESDVASYKLGETITFTCECRVVKRNNHLLSDDQGGDNVEHDIVLYMASAERA